MTVPWVYVRRVLAERWGVPPWQVDEAPHDEVRLELALMSLEAECQPAPATPTAPAALPR